MEWPRVKNIIIAILILLNGFLLVLVAVRRNETIRYEQSVLDRTVQVLKQNGIEMSADAAVTTTGMAQGTAERSLEQEKKLSAALLGAEVEESNLGGGLYSYTAPAGTVNFRTGGEVTLRPADSPMWHTDDPAAHAAALVSAMELECRLADNSLVGGNGTVSYLQLLKGTPLFSCEIVFTYKDGCLTGLSGVLLVTEKPETEDGQFLNLPTVLMGFLDEVLSSGEVCSTILSVEPGYLLTQSFSNTVRLQPVWYISTNTADYYADGITGAVTHIMQMSRASE